MKKIAFVVAAGLALMGCDEAEERGGAQLFAENCAVCHGNSGRGDGPAAGGLDQKPADLSTIARRSGGTFPADEILAKIHGYGGPGHFGDMPDFADLDDGPQVDWVTADGQVIATPRALVELVRYVERLQR